LGIFSGSRGIGKVVGT